MIRSACFAFVLALTGSVLPVDARAQSGPVHASGVTGRVLAGPAMAVQGVAAQRVSAPRQVVTVRTRSSSSQTAKIGLWRRQADGSYVRRHGPYHADIGASGVGTTREGLSRTPAGVFTLTSAFGRSAEPGTRLAYFRTSNRDWWDEDPASPRYNRHVVQTDNPGGASENLYYAGHAYADAVVIDYNVHPVVPGAGSGFFLHITAHVPTAGCVAVSHRHLRTIMQWLNPARRPVISIGVGTDATRVLHGG